MSRYIYKIMSLIIVILSLCSVFVIDACVESDKIDKMIYEFKAEGEFIYQKDNINYYVVKNKNAEKDTNSTIFRENNKFGTTGDIYLFDKSPVEDIPILGWVSSKTWIGHCGLVYNNDASKVLETVGNQNISSNKVRLFENDWSDSSSPRFLVLRVKGVDEGMKEEIEKVSNDYINKKYNYTFLFSNKNKVNCCELICDIYKNVGIDINKDKFYSTGSDFITSESVYIIMYRETYYKDNKKYYNVYYLAEE